MRLMKTELRVLFFSPIAWIVLIIFVFQAGINYCDVLKFQLREVAMGKSAYNLTYYLVCGYSGVYAKMLETLYLYIPLLTMGLMSRELSSGSIKLLYSSPVSNLQIVLGKYLAMVVYGLIFMLLLLIPMVFTVFCVKDADIPFMFTGLLGVFLPVCAYAAIGLFMSALTRYQVVAAIGTFVVLAALNFVGQIGQDIDFIRDLTYWLSISGRSAPFMDGLICSKDVIYFVLVVFMFLAFTLLRLQSERSKRSVLKTCVSYCVVFLFLLAAGYLSSCPKFLAYYDATANKRNSLSEYSQEIVNKIHGKLSLTTYVNLLDDTWYRGAPNARNTDKARFDKYLRYLPDLEMKYVYYYGKGRSFSYGNQYKDLSLKEQMEKMCEGYDYDPDMFISAEQVNQMDDISAEDGRFVRVLKLDNEKKAFLRLYEDIWVYPLEKEITTALKTFVEKSPVVGFVSGHGERDCDDFGEKGYGEFATNRVSRNALINQGFQIRTVSLKQPVPEEVDMLVISDMKSPLDSAEYSNYYSFLDRGGNLIILGEPRRQENMNPLIEKMGLRFSKGILVAPSEEFSDEIVISSMAEGALKYPEYFGALVGSAAKIVTPSACALEVTDSTKGFEISTLLTSPSKGGWVEYGTTDFLSQKSVLNPERGEVEKAYPVMLYLTRSLAGTREQRIFVLGDADCISSKELKEQRFGINSSNFNLLTQMFRCLAYGEYPVYVGWKRMTDDVLYIAQKDLIWCNILLAWGPGLILMVWCVIFLIRRKRK